MNCFIKYYKKTTDFIFIQHNEKLYIFTKSSLKQYTNNKNKHL